MDSPDKETNGALNGSNGEQNRANEIKTETNGAPQSALPHPPPVSPNITPVKVEAEPVKKKLRVPMARRRLGSKGQRIQLLTNHFKVAVKNTDGQFFHYSVAIFYEDGHPVDAKGVGRRIFDKVHETCASELAGKVCVCREEKAEEVELPKYQHRAKERREDQNPVMARLN